MSDDRARSRRGKLLNELATIALAKHDAESGFLARTGGGSAAKGLQVLAKSGKNIVDSSMDGALC